MLTMTEKNKTILIGLMVLLFLLGSMLFVYGVKNGQEAAIQLTKPAGESGWTTSREQMNFTMYGICGLGALWVITAHILLIIFISKDLSLSMVRASKQWHANKEWVDFEIYKYKNWFMY